MHSLFSEVDLEMLALRPAHSFSPKKEMLHILNVCFKKSYTEAKKVQLTRQKMY